MATFGSGIRTIESGTADQAMQTARSAGGVLGYLDPDSVDTAVRSARADDETIRPADNADGLHFSTAGYVTYAGAITRPVAARHAAPTLI